MRSEATLPSVGCEHMPKKQARIQAAGDVALLEGTPPEERTRILCEAMIRRKAERCAATRCPKCWFPTNSSGTNYCICSSMSPLCFRKNPRFLIYMHPRDWYNAGDDAKILLNAAPSSTELFVFGRPGDDQRLHDALVQAGPFGMILFPDEAALTVDQYLSRCRPAAANADRSAEPPAAVPCLGEVALHPEAAAGAASCDLTAAAAVPSPPLRPTIVVVDGTWNNVKQMVRHLSRNVSPGTPHVKLEPTELSVYARTQTRSDGVSSIEAVALLLRNLGEDEKVCSELVRYITVNNEALRLKGGSKLDESKAPAATAADAANPSPDLDQQPSR